MPNIEEILKEFDEKFVAIDKKIYKPSQIGKLVIGANVVNLKKFLKSALEQYGKQVRQDTLDEVKEKLSNLSLLSLVVSVMENLAKDDKKANSRHVILGILEVITKINNIISTLREKQI